MKEMQTNWIGRSQGAEIEFRVNLTPSPSPEKEESKFQTIRTTVDGYGDILKAHARDNRKNATYAEDLTLAKIDAIIN